MKRTALILSMILVLSAGITRAKEPEKLALTPPMGWNSWNCFDEEINEEQIRQIADLMVSTGMRDAGYTYLNLDDGWQYSSRGDDGRIVVDPDKFPSGMKALADYVHSKGLKFGIYSCAGTQTCTRRPGSRGYEFQDARTYAQWGVDFLKYDWCHTNGANAKEAYTLMSTALAVTGRPIVFSICEWGHNEPWKWAEGVGHMWRISGDIIPLCDGLSYWGGFGIFNIIDKIEPLRRYSGPGHWNDAEMLQVGNGNLTLDENRMHFSMWCMLSTPLIAGNDLRVMKKEILEILTNSEAIAINQDKLGKQGRRFLQMGDHEIWVKELTDGDGAICFFNRSDKEWKFDYRFVDYDCANLKCKDKTYTIRDLWAHKNLGDTSKEYTFKVPPHGTVLLRLSPAE